MSDEFEIEETMTAENPASTEVDREAQKVREPSQPVEVENPALGIPASVEASALSLASVIDVPLRVTVEIGATKMLVREVLQLNKGSVVPLDRSSGEPADILVNGRLIARGEVTVLDESLAVRIVELVSRESSDGAR